jgi:hypothetical protein
MAIGRISGPLLKANLVREGVNLAFETDLLYLDVVNSRIGVNKGSPTSVAGLAEYDLDVNGTTRTTNLIVDTQADLAEIRVTGNTISSLNNIINFVPAGGAATVYNARLQVNDLEITGNTISTFVSSSNIEFRPNGLGIVDIYSNTTVNGNLTVTGNLGVTGNVTIGGDITIGDALTDTITINAAIKSSLIPETDNLRDLGSEDFRWRNVYAQNFFTDMLSLNSLDIGNLMFRDNEITTTTGTDLVLFGNGTGGVRLGNFRFRDNTITNVSSNAISQLTSTGDGYFKIAGTNGLVFPRGTNAERPTAYAVVGMARYNTELRALEIWDGFSWASPAGSSGSVTGVQAEDIAVTWALTLG